MITLKQLIRIPEYLTYDDVLLLPNYSEITPSKVETKTSLTKTLKLDLPIIASPMDTVCEKELAVNLGKLGGYGVIHRNLSVDKQADQLSWVLKQKVKAGAAVGVGADFSDRVRAISLAGGREIWIDSAHGHTRAVIQAVKRIKLEYPKLAVIAGNVATYEGARDLFLAGAEVVKVGMGPGSICTTRVMSGMGVPQLSALVDGVRAAKRFNRTIIADGGIKTSGDIVKALAAGADAVMLGSLLAGVAETPGKLVVFKGQKYKLYRGMGSVAAMKHGSAERYNQIKTAKKLVPEGVEGWVSYKGKLEDYLFLLVGGLRSGMAYLGAKNLGQLRKKARFIRISRAGVQESKPHSVFLLDK